MVKWRKESLWCKTSWSSLSLSDLFPWGLFLLTKMSFSQIGAGLPPSPLLRVFVQMPLFSLRPPLTTWFEIRILHLAHTRIPGNPYVPSCQVRYLLSTFMLLRLCALNGSSQQYSILSDWSFLYKNKKTVPEWESSRWQLSWNVAVCLLLLAENACLSLFHFISHFIVS